MGMFSKVHNDGEHTPDRPRATIGERDWRAIQDRAFRANPALRDTLSPESTRRRVQGGANHRDREMN